MRTRSEGAAQVVDRWRAPFGLEPSELAQGFVFLAAHRALLEVAVEERQTDVGGLARDFKIHVLRQELEARIARQLLVGCVRDEPQEALELDPVHTMFR